MLPSPWKDAVITFGTNPTTTPEVNLDGAYEFLTVLNPTLNNASTITVHISNTSGGTFYPIHMFDTAAQGDYAQLTDDEDTSKGTIFRIGGAQFIKVVCADNQSANITFKVRGFNRG